MFKPEQEEVNFITVQAERKFILRKEPDQQAEVQDEEDQQAQRELKPDPEEESSP